MAGSSLLEDKSAPTDKKVQAAVVAFFVIGAVCLFLGEISNEIENTFHVWNHTAAQAEELKREMKTHPAMVLGLIAIFPLTAILTIVMILPLGVYVTDYAAFQNLSPVRPDHYIKVCFKVYRAWFAGGDGKLKAKDL